MAMMTNGHVTTSSQHIQVAAMAAATAVGGIFFFCSNHFYFFIRLHMNYNYNGHDEHTTTKHLDKLGYSCDMVLFLDDFN